MKKIFIISFAIAFSTLTGCNSAAQQQNLSVASFEKALNGNDVQILDVRTAEEYQSGHIDHALQADWTNENEFRSRIQSLDKSKPVYTYCLSGGRSGAATKWLNANGYTAYNLSGGINAWRNENKPLAVDVLTKQISAEEYQSMIPSDKTVLVDFSAVWCPPCKKMAPQVDSLMKSRPEIVFVKIDGGAQAGLCKQLSVEEFPTFIVYKQGKISWRKSGLIDISELASGLQ
ncbi:MAG: thioredoxin fold domain-containing protein [Bacteroidetes bacterium]|jgi:rhodanese-related sulfurtransferase|nr:thioredoxin fold domain-containing protein [Bacteroidota bacterium]